MTKCVGSLQRVSLLVPALTLLTLSCRDGVPLFTPPTFEFGAQLTFGTGEDRDPRWLPDGSGIVYHSNRYDALPAGGVLLRIPADGGTASPLLEDVQRAAPRVRATPVISPNGEFVAYLDLIRIDEIAPCTASTNPNECVGTQPLLDSAALRVRRLDAVQPPTADPSVGIKLAGTDPLFRSRGSGQYVMQALPFQLQYRTGGAVVLRPSWAPDNQRIVFSNGNGLFIWRVGEATAAAVAGTADGVSPAWSPSGDRIAFTQLTRTDSTEIRCSCMEPGTSAFAVHVRMIYSVAAPRLVLIRPDGSDRIDLGAGEDPVWSPDGRALYVRRNNEIVRVPVDGGAAQVIPNTQGARFPAVSPDGRRLAMSRPSSRNDYDIWVVSLPQ